MGKLQGTGPLSFDVPADAVSFTLFVSAPGKAPVAFERIGAPGGRTLYTRRDPDGSPERLVPSFAPLTAVVPNAPRVAFGAGSYEVQVLNGSGAEVEADVRVHLKLFSGPPPESGGVDISYVFVGLDDVDPQNVAGHGFLGPALAGFRKIMSSAGISVGRERFETLSGEAGARFTHIDTCEGPNSELHELLTYGHHPDDPQYVSVFVVQDLTDPAYAGFTLGGYDGALPGPPVTGTPQSGVAVATLGYGWPAEGFAKALAHEVGHYLGLFHATEMDGASVDPLDDTPTCGADRDADRDGVLQGSECKDLGGYDIMFWQTGPDTATTFSGQQRWAMLRHPLVY
jgi:hypothetical protein